MKLSTTVQEGCGYKDTLRSPRYFAPLAKYFTVCITYQPPLVNGYSMHICGPGSVVGIATGYRRVWALNPSGGEIFHTCLDRPHGPPSLLYSGYRVFPRVKSGRGVTLTPHPLLLPWSWKNRAIPLLRLWAVQSVQSLSACTRVHFTFTPWISAGYLMPLVGFKYGVHVFKGETTWTLRDCVAESAHTTRLEGQFSD